MHMSDALISPVVGGLGWAVTIATSIYAARRLKKAPNHEKTVPMMAVLAAFVFAAQMINFTIPGTGSSGHLTGALLMAILLGPEAAFFALASVVTLQALFFADGGLLALGCNIVNMGMLPCFVIYPLVYRPLAGKAGNTTRRWFACVAAGVIGCAVGSFAVVLETAASGISELPFGQFVLMMVPIHLAIGVVEGLVTLAVTAFLAKARPEMLHDGQVAGPRMSGGYTNVAVAVLIAAVFTGGVVSWMASKNPDGLEWSTAKVTGTEEIKGASDSGIHKTLGDLQKSISFLPDYDFKKAEEHPKEEAAPAAHAASAAPAEPLVNTGKSLAGILGAVMTLALAGIIGMVLRRRASTATSATTQDPH